MPTAVSMPQLGETVTEGTVLRWMKQVGDRIAQDEPLVEISTDKVDTEVPSPAAGVISSILVGEGETITVGTAMAVIGGDAGDLGEETQVLSPSELSSLAETSPGQEVGPPPVPEPAEWRPSRSRAPRPRRRGAGQFLSPVVRRLAREHDLDPTEIEGTGRDGRVTRNDVLAHLDRIQAARAAQPSAPPVTPPAPEPRDSEPLISEPPPPPAPEPSPPPTLEPAPPAAPEPPPPVSEPRPAAAAGPEEESRKLSRLRVRIAGNMMKSLQSAAHVWTSMEVDYEAVERVRRARRQEFKRAEGFSLTYLPFIARATMEALRAFPVVNSSFDQENRTATYHPNIDLGIAIDLNQEGLMVATIKNADDYSMSALARRIRDVAQRAREGRVGPDDVTGSTFTITNPGPYGSFMSAPIINVPNVAILSTDTVTKRARVVTTADGQDVIAIRPVGYLGLSWDHRAFDGSTAVLFLRSIRDNLENWDWDQQLP